MLIISEAANNYATAHTSTESDLLREVNEYTLANQHGYQMLSGPVQGQFLQMVSTMMRPERILEIGTYTGYSALCLAAGLSPTGQLHTIEYDGATAEIARGFFNKSETAAQIISHTGNALHIIPKLEETWDLVFIDADKPAYIDYYELTLPQLRKNGIIIADNVLFHGEVPDEQRKGKNAIALHAFNERVRNDNRVAHVLLTVRDGLMLIQKK